MLSATGTIGSSAPKSASTGTSIRSSAGRRVVVDHRGDQSPVRLVLGKNGKRDVVERLREAVGLQMLPCDRQPIARPHHRDHAVVVTPNLVDLALGNAGSGYVRTVAHRSCSPGVTPGPELVTTNAASGHRAAASTTTQPP